MVIQTPTIKGVRLNLQIPSAYQLTCVVDNFRSLWSQWSWWLLIIITTMAMTIRKTIKMEIWWEKKQNLCDGESEVARNGVADDATTAKQHHHHHHLKWRRAAARSVCVCWQYICQRQSQVSGRTKMITTATSGEAAKVSHLWKYWNWSLVSENHSTLYLN